MSDLALLVTALAAAIEEAVNKVLALDPEGRARLAQMEGKIVAFEVQGLGITLALRPHAEGLDVMTNYPGEPDAVLSGGPFSLARLGLTGARDGLFGTDVSIRGDVELGQRFQRTLNGIDVDWEEHLSHLVGDIAAHQTGRLLRGVRDWLGQAGRTSERNAGEYLQLESGMLPLKEEVEPFLAAVDRLRDDADRLAARVERLQKHLKG